MRLITVILVFVTLPIFGQSDPDLSSITSAEKKLREYFLMLQPENNDVIKDSVNNVILKVFQECLASPVSFFYPWPELDMIGKVKSEDNRVKVFTWHIQKNDNTYIYYGIIQHRIPGRRKEDNISVFLLNDLSSSQKNAELLELSTDTWYGALYFSASMHTHRRKTWYSLLGFDFNDNFSNKKIIEVLHFEQDKPVFGAEIKTETETVKRLIFEYSSNVVMALRFDDNLKQIVFDHLSPIESIFKGMYRFYVPDGSYDALKFRKGSFSLEKDVDARNY